MPIVITPTGQFVDSATGNPVDLPPQRPDLPRQTIGQAAMPDMLQAAMPDMLPEAIGRDLRTVGGARARENIPANMDMGMDSEMPVPMTVVDQVNALMQMGLTEDEALAAIAIERSAGQIQPQDFGQAGQEQQMQQMSNPGMGALGGVGAMMPPPTPRGSTNMGMPEDAVMEQRINQVDTRGLSPQQINMLRMGRDPFAEGMVR